MVTNEILLAEIIKARELGEMTEELYMMIHAIVEALAKKPQWEGIDEYLLEEMKSEARVHLMKHGLKFDPTKSDNPFAYYSTSIHGSFLGVWCNERKQNDYRQ
jgi:hypothetical protein